MTKTYRLAKDVSGSANLAGLGSVDFAFDAGTVTPKDEKDAAALEHLESIGLASTAKPEKANKTTAEITAAKPTDKVEE